MGTETHGTNEVNPIVPRKIWEWYNVPRSIHRLDVQKISFTEMTKLQQNKTSFLKTFQTLPTFSPTIVLHILIGGRTMTCAIHKKMLSLLMNIRRKNGIEADIARRQLSMKKATSKSWFIRANKVAEIYGLPNSYLVFEEEPWDKKNWKNII